MKDILMSGGLDLVKSKALAAPGTLADCENYEVGIYPGYSPSGGFERFDGHISPSNTDVWDMVISNVSIKPGETANRTLSVTQDTIQTGLAFTHDGSRMYLLGTGSNRVYEFYLSTPWDITTAAHRPSAFLTVTTEDSNPQALAFSHESEAAGIDEGERMYVVGTANNAVYEYELFEPGNLVVGAAFLNSFSLAAQETSPNGISFSPDGLMMFISGNQVGQIHRYDLATPWNFTDGVTFVHSLDVSDYDNDLRGVQFTSDGHVFYVGVADGVLCFSCETAWDLTTAEFLTAHARGGVDNDNIYLSPDDGLLFILDPDDDLVHEYGWGFRPNETMEWSLAGNTGSLGVVVSTSIGFEDTTVRFAYWDPNDSLPPAATVTGANGATFTEGIESLFWDGNSFSFAAQDTEVKGVFFRDDGLTMFAAGHANKRIFKYTLALPWDIDTAAYSGVSFDVSVPVTSGPYGVWFKPDGTRMYVLDRDGGQVVQYNLAVPWDITTSVYTSVGGGGGFGFGFTISPDGVHLYIVGTATNSTDIPGGYIYEFTMTTAWDISTTGSLTNKTKITNLGNGAFEEAQINAIAFEPDGLTMYLHMPALLEFHTYELTTAWDTSTLTPTAHYFHHDVTESTGIFVDGPRFFLHYDQEIYKYDFYHHAEFTALRDATDTVVEYQDALFGVSEVFREAITEVPGSGPVLGEKWYKGSLYAVRDYYRFNFRAGSGLEPQVGQHVLIGDGDEEGFGSGSVFFSHEGIVREIVLESGEWADDSATGTILVEPLDNAFAWENRLGYGIKNNYLWMLGEFYFESGSVEPEPGQSLIGDTSTSEIKVWRVELQSGSWEDGDAAGVIYFNHQGGPITPGEDMDRSSPVAANVMTAVDPYPTVYSAILTEASMEFHSKNHSGASMAGLYRSSRDGWVKVDLGHEVKFVDGNNGGNAPEPIKFGADTSSATVTASAWAVPSAIPVSGFSPDSGDEVAAISGAAGTYLEGNLTDENFARETVRPGLAVTGFNLELPVGARVVGVEIEITAKNVEAATNGAGLFAIQPFLYDATKAEGGNLEGIVTRRQAVGELTVAFTAYTFGGANDLWGAAIDRDMVMDPNFGVKCNIEWDFDLDGADLQIDLIRMRVHYVEQGQLIYFYDTANTADYATARLVHLHTQSGTWGAGDAAGSMQVYGLTKSLIPSLGVEIRTAAAGGGTLIANMEGNERRVSLAGRKLLIAENSKYEMIAENVYARDDLEAIYGCNGAGPAFSYDGFYLRIIRSGLSPDLDKPRHVDLFQFRLWLGYEFGEAAISTAGEPLVFDGSLNAVATGFGRPITGFMPLAGKTMGVFTDRSIYAVTVEGADFDQQVFSPNSGSLEYTAQSVGSIATFLDSRGLSNPQTTQNYGDFDVRPMSKAVRPWLVPRLQSRAEVNERGRKDATATTVCRAKNQFRAYFADGYRLTFTFTGEVPEPTRQRLYTGGDPDKYVRVLATESEVTEDGSERLFFSMDSNPDHDASELFGYCYEEDRGTSYDGSEYKRFIELNPISGAAGIHDEHTWGLMHFYGMSHGYVPIRITTANDFAHPADADDTTEDSRYDLALGAATNEMTTDLEAQWDKQRHSPRRGRHLSMRFQGESDRELPHLIQHIWFDEKSGRQER